MYTKSLLALIKRVSIYFSDFLKKRRVWPQVICLLSMLMPESQHTDFSKSCLCLYTGDACCQRNNKFRLCNFSERKNFHLSLKRYVHAYPKASGFVFLGTHVHTFFTCNENFCSFKITKEHCLQILLF